MVRKQQPSLHLSSPLRSSQVAGLKPGRGKLLGLGRRTGAIWAAMGEAAERVD